MSRTTDSKSRVWRDESGALVVGEEVGSITGSTGFVFGPRDLVRWVSCLVRRTEK